MTGRDLIIYILENGLEDEPIIQDGMIVMKNLGYIPLDEAALILKVGFTTILSLLMRGDITGLRICGKTYILASSIQSLLDRKKRKE